MNKILLSMCLLLVVGCAPSPDYVRRMAANCEPVYVAAKRSEVAASITQQLKVIAALKPDNHWQVIEVVETKASLPFDAPRNVESVQFKSDDRFFWVFDLEDAVSGTMVTVYAWAGGSVGKALEIVDRARRSLEKK